MSVSLFTQHTSVDLYTMSVIVFSRLGAADDSDDDDIIFENSENDLQQVDDLQVLYIY